VALMSVERAVHSARAAALGSDTILMIGQSPNIDPYITSTMHSVRLAGLLRHPLPLERL
jgi:hypothetical protein